MSTPQKHARHAPISAVRNIVDFLMFFYNGKDDQATHNFIMSHASDCIKSSSTLAKRFELYKLTAYLVREKSWSDVALEDLLAEIIDLEEKYGGEKKTPNAGIAKSKWNAVMRKIVFHIGLYHLRKTLNIDDDDVSDISIPRTLSIEDYREDIEQLFNGRKKHYIINEATGDVHHQFNADLEALTSELFTEAPAKKAPKGKNARRPASELTFDVAEVKDLLAEYPDQNLVDTVVSFIHLIEEKVLPVPVEVGRYTGADEQDIHSVLRRLSGVSTAPAPLPLTAVTSADRPLPSSAALSGSASRGAVRHEADWTEEQADTFGPYAAAVAAGPSPAASKKPKQRQVAPKSPQLAESPERVRKQRRGTSSRSGAAPAALAAADDFGYDAGAGSDDRAAAAGGTEKLREARHRLLAYQDYDPLTEALGSAAGAASAQARVSREELLRVCKEQADALAARRLSGGSASITKAAKKVRPRTSSGKLTSSDRRGSKIDFSSDDESLEEVDEDEVAAAGAVQTLRNLKQTLPTAADFPAHLGSPSVGSASGRKGKKSKELKRLPKTAQVRIKWTFEQEEMLREAVGRFGAGNWLAILNDPEYSIVFAGRTNVNLKDKWRNIELKEQREHRSILSSA